ncbi:MAG: extracellular solute-binding protein [Paracoccus aminovorans]|nr:extracellular solute-binding protein [Paracoccus aminovorans]
MVFTSWGGTTQDAQTEFWAAPFTEKSGTAVLQDGPTDYGKIKAMVEAGAVAWDVVDTEFDWALQAGKAGLLEPLDFGVIDKAKLDPRFVSDYAVGSFYYSFVIGFNPANFSGEAQPQTMADLFDTAKFPGKRTFYKWSAPGVIEAALLADGVPANQLYPLDLDRAFKKLDTIKSSIIWWEGGAQSQQLLASGEAPIGLFWNGRLAALQADGMPVGIELAGQHHRRRRPGRSQGRQEQGGRHGLHRRGDQRQGTGGFRDQDRLCPDQPRLALADGGRSARHPARRADRQPDQRRHGLLGRASR